MSNPHYRVDIGRWTLSRRRGEVKVELEPGPLVTIPARDKSHTVEASESPSRAELFRQLLESGEVRNRAELARRFGISRARVTQILGACNSEPQSKAK